MAITLNGTTGISSPGGDTSTSLATTNLSYTGTLTGGTGVIAIGTNQIYKDASGNVGIGTGTPANKVHISGDGSASLLKVQATNTNGTASINLVPNGTGNGQIYTESGALLFSPANTERMRLDASGNLGLGTSLPTTILTLRKAIDSAAYGSGTNMIDFKSYFTGYDTETVKASIYCGVDSAVPQNTTNGFFAIKTTNAGVLYERCRVDTFGNLLVGDTAFSYGYNGRLFARNDVNTTPVAATINKIASGNVYGIINSFLSNGNNTLSYHFSGVTQGVAQWYLYGNGTSSFTSDERKKKNIETTRNGYLEDLCKLRVVKYNWWTDDDGTPKELGLIAQEVEQIFPGLITNAIHPDVDGETYKVMKGSVIPFMLLKAIQELTTRLEALEAQ